MARPLVLIFHRSSTDGDAPLVRLLADVRGRLADEQAQMFVRAGAGKVRSVTDWRKGLAFGDVLRDLAPPRGGLVVLGSGAVARLDDADARRLIDAAASHERIALTNNRYSSDICAIATAQVLRELPPLPSDNALPRWLERVGYRVAELPGRERLALDIDSPLDVALAAMAPGAPAWLRLTAREAGLEVPRLGELRDVTRDAHAELLVFGRSGSRTLRWLEQNVRCRVRFMAEERGMRAATQLAIGAPGGSPRRPPVASLGMLLDQRGPAALAQIVAELSDAAVIDSRVILAHRLGPDESVWPSAGDRFASDLHRAHHVKDPWLRALTESAAANARPILLGGHTLVGPGIPILLRRPR